MSSPRKEVRWPTASPSQSRAEETLSVFPKAEADVPAPPKDTLNEGALAMFHEGQSYTPKFTSASRPGKKS